MAYLSNGNLTGKLGNLTGFVRDGKNLFRVNSRRTAPPTEKELLNRYIFRLVQDWVTPLNPLLKLGFRNYSENLTGANAAKSLIFRNALQRDGYDSFIEPSEVQVSSGRLPLPSQLAAVYLGNGMVEFSWNHSSEGIASPRDRIMMLAYNTTAGRAQYELSGAKRYQGLDRLSLTSVLPGTLHVYAAFISDEGGGQSESRYLGAFTVEG